MLAVWTFFAGALSTSAQSAYLASMWWTSPVDNDGDGCVSSARLNWDPNVSDGVSTLLVYERIYYRPSGSGSWTLLLQTGTHYITGSSIFDSQYLVVNGKGNCNFYDYRIEIYRAAYAYPFWDYWYELPSHREETSALDVSVATIYDAWWSNLEDYDNDGCASQARLTWDPDVAGSGSLVVYEKIYYRPTGGSTWTLYYTTGTHVINGVSTADAQYLNVPGSTACAAYDWAIEVYRSGLNSPDYTRLPGNDGDLFNRQFEWFYYDVPPDRFEPNNNAAAAKILTNHPAYGVAYERSLTLPQGDEDWFKFTTGDWGRSYDFASVYFDSSAGDVALLLLDENQNPLAFALDWDFDNYAIMSLSGLPPGTYYLGVGILSGLPQPYYELAVSAPLRSAAPDRFENNNDFATATILGTMVGLTNVPMLSIHSANDVDVFRITTTATGARGDLAAIQFRNAEGNLGLALYNSSYALLDWVNGSTDGEVLSLEGLPPGNYYVLVYGSFSAANLNYSLSIKSPGLGGILADAYEANDSKAQVDGRTNAVPNSPRLGTLVAPRLLENLNLHAPGNADWFRFELATNGGVGHFVALVHDYRLGDLDLRLCDSNGVTLSGRVASGLREVERVDLQGLAAGTYYAVVEGWQNATNPLYQLVFYPPTPGDTFEANDSAATATDLRQLQGQLAFDNLSLHTSSDTDWFHFQVAETPTVAHWAQIAFSQAQGNLDLELYDYNTNRIRSSITASDTERVTLEGLRPGSNYFLRVLGQANPQYSLSFNLPGSVAGDFAETNNTRATAYVVSNGYGGTITLGETARPLSIHTATDVDWFKFTLGQTGSVSHFVAILLDHTLGDLDLELYRGADPAPIATSVGVANTHRISLNGFAPGDYYARVLGYNGAVNPAYQLQLSAPLVGPAGDALEPNDSAGTARNLGTVNGTYNRPNLSIHATNDSDWFQFTLPAGGGLGHFARITFTHALGDLDLELYQTNGTLLAQSAGVTDVETISLQGLAAGPYRLRVLGYRQALNPTYTLTIVGPQNAAGDWADQPRGATPNNNTAGNAYDLRQVRGFQTWDPLSIHTAGDVDWFRITTVTNSAKGHFVAIQFDTVLGDLDLYVYDSSGTTLLRSSETVNGVESIDLSELSNGGLPGTYLIKVAGHNGAVNPAYQLFVNAPEPNYGDRYEPNESQIAAADLKEIQGTQAFPGLSMHQGADQDWFKFSTAGSGVEGHAVSILYDHALGNLALQVMTAGGQTLVSSNLSDRQTVSLAGVPAGTHFIRVTGATNGATQPNYTLLISAWQSPSRDWAETNDTQVLATDLREVHGVLPLANLSIHASTDVDWFKFQLAMPGAAGQSARIDFNRFEGALVMELLDPQGHTIRADAGDVNYQEISLAGLTNGLYYLKIAGTNGSTNPNYSLTLNTTPELRPDFAEVNDTPGAAYDLRSLTAARAGSMSRTPYIIQNEDYQGVGLYGNLNNSPDVYVHGNDYIGLYQGVQQIAQAQNPAGYHFNPVQSSAVYGDFNLLHNLGLNSLGLDSTYAAFNPGSIVAGLANDPILNSLGLGAAFGSSSGSSPYLGLNPLGPFNSSPLGALSGGFVSTPLVQPPTFVQPQPMVRPPVQNNAALLLLFYLLTRSDTAPNPAVLPDLSIDHSGDEDWFRFELPAPGAAGQAVSIVFDATFGELKLELYEAFNPTNPPANYSIYLVNTAAGGGNTQSIGLAGLAPGAYYARVTGVGTNTNPSYALALNVAPVTTVPGDFAETNDTVSTAYDLRTVDGVATLTGLSIHTTNDVDWFAFTLAANGMTGHVARIDFSHAAGDLDCELYNGAGTMLLGASAGVGNAETVSLAGLTAGTYKLKVFGYRKASNPHYTLTIIAPNSSLPPDRWEPNNDFAQATDLAWLNNPSRLEGMTIHQGAPGGADDDRDLFKFTIAAGVTAGPSHGLNLDYERAQGLLDIDLYKVVSGAPVLLSFSSGTNDETVSLSGLNEGTYYALVKGAATDVANRYTLHLSLPPASVAQPSPANEWTVMIYMTASDLYEFALADINEMELAAARLPANVKIAVLWDQSLLAETYGTGDGSQSAWGGTGRAIIQPDTRREVVATTFDLSFGEENTADPATLTSFISYAAANAPARHYALILWDHGGGVLSGFNLDNEGNRFATGADRLYHDQLPAALNALPMNVRSNIEVIAFDACLMGMAEVGYALRNHCRVFVASEETEGGAGYDYTTAFAALQVNPALVTPAQFAAGVVQSYQSQYQGDRQGQDTHAAILTSQLDDGALMLALRNFADATANASAFDWSVLRDARYRATSFQQSDFYRDLGQFLDAVAASNASLPLRASAAAAATALRSAIAARAADRRNTSGLSIYLPAYGSSIPSGYFARNGGFLSATHWDQFLARFLGNSGGRSFAADWSEANDVAPRAFDLHTLVGSNAFPALSLHEAGDQDWFRFTLLQPPIAGNRVRALSAAGTLDLELHRVLADGSRTRLTNGTGSVALDQLGLGAGELLVLVRGDGLAAVPDYTLVMETPGSMATRSSWVGANDSADKAHDLGVIVGPTMFAGLAINSGETNWFLFATPRNQLTQSGVLFVTPAAGQSLAVTLLQSNGAAFTPPRTAAGARTLLLEYPAGAGLGYRLQVRSATAETATYALRFDPNVSLSPRLTGAERLVDGGFRFTINGLAGSTNEIQYTTNFMQWATLTRFFNADGVWSFVDTTASNSPARYYRVALLP